MSLPRFDILTIFPQIFNSYFQESIIKRALKNKKIEIKVHDIRAFSKDRHHKVDAPPYGGGSGMLMTPQPLYDAIQHAKTYNSGPVLFTSPRGKILTQTKVLQLVKIARGQKKYKKNSTSNSQFSILNSSSSIPSPGLILVCGHYEGIDQRVIDLIIDEEISIGKYILTGGELAAMVILDSVSRHISGVLGDKNSHEEESFSKTLKGKKEYPHYTRPEIFMGKKVPEVLLSGHHAKIKKWREEHLR